MSSERVLTCEEALRFLAAYLDGELDAAWEADIETHLSRCRSCYSRADFEKRLKGQLAALSQADVPAAFAARIGVPLDTVRNWEQGKRLPAGPAKALLKILDRAPEAALSALS